MKYLYIILFEDKTMVTSAMRPEKAHFQVGARFFQVRYDMPICELVYWFSIGNPEKIYGKDLLMEIKGGMNDKG